MEEVVEIEKHKPSNGNYSNSLKIILDYSKTENQLFFLHRYPGQKIQLARSSKKTDNSLSIVSYNRSTSIVVDQIEFISLSELDQHVGIDIEQSSLITNPITVNTTDQITFEKNVALAIEEIKANRIEKVVLSKVKELNKTIDPIASFFNLEAKYKRAFVYCIYHPAIGVWMGASPEKLLEKTGADTYQIHSIAGTKAINDKWTSKEVDEQRIVTDYVLDQLPKDKIADINVNGPIDLKYGNIKHLKTSISFATKAKNSTIIDAIHPTPAVCGIPVEKAKSFIKENENYDRSLYTGYIGLKIPTQNTESYFVNLRCMQLTDDNCYIYTGAGIVADSIPSEEWKEVEAKAQTLVDCLSIHE